jgi:D-arginine dehydrogenase
VERFPSLRLDIVRTAVWDATTQDIDVAAAVQAFRRALRSRGGSTLMSARVRTIERRDRDWQVTTPNDVLVAPLIVDAAGAWADEVAALAGVPRLGLQPLRRTLCTFDAPDGLDGSRWPLLLDAAERFYMKPEGAGFMASPADEVLVEPGDPRPLMDDVALALERVRWFTRLDARSVRSSWAGLRTFAPDRSLVLGPDPTVDGFAWSAGQGGFGIMTAPASARSVVSLVETGELPEDVVAAGGRSASVLPDRLCA